MIVIADSGSTKADWRFVDGEELKRQETIGVSPILHPQEVILDALQSKIASDIGVTQVNYYGTGCSLPANRAIMSGILNKLFPKANIAVETDLMGAARAACGNHPGIACILGTGSNSCLYDGEKIVDQVANLGYILGDEGSGNYIGKMLLRAYFYRELPMDLEKKMSAVLPGGRAYVLEKLYGDSRANAFLASFTTFVGTHRAHPFMQKLLQDAFGDFVDRNISKYDGYQTLPVHFIGSIAFHFQDFLKKVLIKRAIQPGVFIKQPIENLVKYHTTDE